VLAVIEWGKVGEVIWVSAVMGIGVIALFAMAIYGGSRASERRRTSQGSAAPFAALAATGLTGFTAIVVFAIVVILNKS
jgi:hypothetical protein